jgi:uncharacterized repeat protein (TIGR01451 family)
MYNLAGSPTLTNVTFSGNSAQLGGGMYNDESHPTVQNSILWGNTAPLLSQIANIGGNYADVRTSIVQGGYINGSGIINADPLFVAPVAAGSAPTTAGDLRLRPASPAIDAGDTALLPAGVTTDREGMPRVIGPRVDLGAFEAYAQLSLSKTVDRPSAGPTERVTYRLVIDNTGAYSSTVILSDTLPSGLTVAGPVTVEPVGGTVGPPPTLVRDLVIRGGQTVTVVLPVDLTVGQPAGTVISNTASLSSTDTLNTSTSTVVVTVLNVAPRTANDLGCVSPDQSVGLPVLRNDDDLNGDPLHITSVSTPSSGTATSDGTVITYTPEAGFVGTASFSYSASDGSLSTSASVRVTVTADIHGACTLYLPLIVQAVDM